MTREEANNIARGITDKIEATTDIDDWAEFWGFTRDDYEEFLDIAIKALEQEPCDCISRAELLKAMDTWDKFGSDAKGLIPLRTPALQDRYVPYVHYDDVLKAIKGMPSIQPKTGHWIAIENEEMETVGYYCSECDLPMETEQRTDFCPNCGADMRESEKVNG